ncbi:unnamed protein product, partial [Nesidiocoris tenuis]
SWTVNEEIEIIYAVQARPALWNVASREYEQAPLKALMWAEVDKAVGKSADPPEQRAGRISRQKTPRPRFQNPQQSRHPYRLGSSSSAAQLAGSHGQFRATWDGGGGKCITWVPTNGNLCKETSNTTTDRLTHRKTRSQIRRENITLISRRPSTNSTAAHNPGTLFRYVRLNRCLRD